MNVMQCQCGQNLTEYNTCYKDESHGYGMIMCCLSCWFDWIKWKSVRGWQYCSKSA